MVYTGRNMAAVNSTNTASSGLEKFMPKHGEKLAIVLGILYVIGGAYWIRNDLTDESINEFKWRLTIPYILIIAQILNLVIYLMRDKSTDEKKESAKNTAGWLSFSPICLAIIIIVVAGTR